MFDRLQKPFLTVETGEAYQPIRLTYDITQPDKFVDALEQLRCIKKNTTPNSWSWFWHEEAEDLNFESTDHYRKGEKPLRLGTLTRRDGCLYLNLPSFKRACLAAPFFHRHLHADILKINSADFINKVFALDERLPHGFTELFKNDELDRILHQRVEDYHKVKELCEDAESPEEAFRILAEFTEKEAKKRLPYAERYIFDMKKSEDPEVIFLAFYIFLRARELVAIKRWFGQTGYSLSDAAEETVVQVFGDLNIEY